MSDPITKRRPMIDLAEFERGLRRPANQRDGEPLAGLLLFTGAHGESHKTVFEPKAQGVVEARQDARYPGERKEPDAQEGAVSGGFAAIGAGLLDTEQPQAAIPPEAEASNAGHKKPNAGVPRISGDFAAIEAGLLGTTQEKDAAIVSESDVSNAFPKVDLGSERWLNQDNSPVSRYGGIADGQGRSRRAFYAMAAIAGAGIAGIAASFGFWSGVSAPPEVPTITAGNGPAPVALVNDTGQSLDLPQADEKIPPAVIQAGSQAPTGDGLAAEAVSVPAASAQTQTLPEPVSTAAPVEPEKMKTASTASVQLDGALLANGTPPQANVIGAPLPPPAPAAAAKARTAKAVEHAAKRPKSAMAADSGGHGQPPRIANKAKAAPADPLNARPAPAADAKAETPAAQPSPATDGAFALMQMAVNSLTSTTAKVLEWGRAETHLGR